MKRERRIINNTQGSTVCETNNTKSVNQQKYQNSVDYTNNETINSRNNVVQSRLLEDKSDGLPKFKNIIKINRNSESQKKSLKRIQEKLEKDRNDINFQNKLQQKMNGNQNDKVNICNQKKKIDNALQTAKQLNFQKQDEEEELIFQGLVATLSFL